MANNFLQIREGLSRAELNRLRMSYTRIRPTDLEEVIFWAAAGVMFFIMLYFSLPTMLSLAKSNFLNTIL